MAPIDLLSCSCRKKCLTPGIQKCPVTMCAETTPGKTAFCNQYCCKEWLETQCIFVLFSFKARQFLFYCILVLMWRKSIESYFWRVVMRFSVDWWWDVLQKGLFTASIVGLCRFNFVSMCPCFFLIVSIRHYFLIIFIWFMICIIPWSSIRHFLNYFLAQSKLYHWNAVLNKRNNRGETLWISHLISLSLSLSLWISSPSHLIRF